MALTSAVLHVPLTVARLVLREAATARSTAAFPGTKTAGTLGCYSSLQSAEQRACR